MRFTNKVVVTGAKRSKGEMEGVKYDSTKFYVQVDLDDRAGNAKGTATQEYSFGTSDEYQKYQHLPFPFEAEADLEIVTTGKVQKVVLHSLKPLSMIDAPKSKVAA